MGWILTCGVVAILVQAGFALLDTGLCRAKNAAHAMSTGFLVFTSSVIGFFAVGFAVMSGGFGGMLSPTHLANAGCWGMVGKSGIFLAGAAHTPELLGRFLSMLAFISIAVTIPAGALAERWSVKSMVLFGLAAGALICPVYGCWTWGGGWLDQLGTKLGWGHGVVDFSGSGLVHLQGGALALICALLLGPRFGKYDTDGRPRAILGHHLPMVFLGTIILAVSFFTLSGAAAIAVDDGRLPLVATNLLLAAVTGIAGSAMYMWVRFGKPDPSMMCNGMLAGLVAVAAPCAFVQPWAAFFIGLVAGVTVIWSIFFLERVGVDDPIGAISIHGLSGAWGMLAIGLFADGSYGTTWNLVPPGMGVKGLFYGDGRQLLAQLVGVGVAIAWNVGVGGLVFWVIGRLVGNRVPVAVEIAGLDIPEMGAPGYPEFIESMTPEMISRSDIAAAEASISRKSKRPDQSPGHRTHSA